MTLMAKRFRLTAWICSGLAMLGGNAYADAPKPLRVQDLKTLSTAELAATMLPPDMAQRMVRHVVDAPILPVFGTPGVRFFDQGRKAGGHLCRKEEIYVSLEAKLERDPARLAQQIVAVSQTMPGDQIAWSRHCESPDQTYAYINYPVQFEEAAQLLSAFARWQTAAGRADLAGTHISCHSEGDTSVCAGAPERVLAYIPLGELFVISRSSGQVPGWNLATTYTGGPIWMILITGDLAHPQGIDLHWGAPPPF